MPRISVPALLDERTFERVLAGKPGKSGDLDARRVAESTPTGALCLAVLAHQLGAADAEPMAPPEALIPPTRLGRADDVDAVQAVAASERVADQLAILGFRRDDTGIFAGIVGELARNVVDHAGAHGWVASWWTPMDQLEVVVADVGCGFRGSLEERHAARFGERWGDAVALEQAFIHALSRHRGAGHGQGIRAVRQQVGTMGGKVSVRSGTARIADIPAWDEHGHPLESGLTPLIGAQVVVTLPRRPAQGWG